MGKYTERVIAWRKNKSGEFLCDIFHEVDADIDHLQREKAELEEASNFNCNTIDELNGMYTKLEAENNALIGRVKAHNEKMMVMIDGLFNVPVKNSSGELSTYREVLMKHYLISLDTTESSNE